MHRLATIAAALLMPVVIDGALIAEAAQEVPEVLVAKNKGDDKKEMGLDDIDRLVNEAEKAEEAGNYQKAVKILEQILAIEEKEVGPEHADVGGTLTWQGSIYIALGSYEKAEPLYLRSLAINEKALGPEHPSTGGSLHSLAVLYSYQGLYSKAEPLYLRALAIRENALGPEHPSTGASLYSLAGLYKSQGLYSKAEPLYLRALAIRENALGPEHPDTGTSLNNLAGLYKSKGLYSKAMPLYLRALAIREKALGPEHPSTGASLNNLAGLYKSKGLYSKAMPLYLRALAIREKALGPEHPSTGASLYSLASLYQHQGLYSKAEPLYLRSLAISEKALGPEHPSTGASLYSLASLYQRQGLYSKAEPLYLRSLAINKKALGPEHPSTGASLYSLAVLYQSLGLYSKAEPLYLRALAIREKALGPEHPSTGASLYSLASLYQRQGLYSKAMPLYLRALAVREKALGPEHPSTGGSLYSLAVLYQRLGLYSKAEPLYLRSLAINGKALGPEHPSTGGSLYSLAVLYQHQGLYGKAVPLYLRALAIREKALGPEHPYTGTSLYSLAVLYQRLGLYSKAEPLARRALDIELTLIQRQSPYLAISERQTYTQSFGHFYESTFSLTSKSSSGSNLALFARLNRQGLLEEIEKRQAKLASSPGPQQDIAKELRGLTQQLASMSLSAEERQNLRARKEDLEKQLYRLLPELEPRIVEVEQVAKAIPGDGVLVEFKRYEPYDDTKASGEKWSDARYLALVLKPNGEIESVDLGLAEPIEEKVQQALRASEERLADAQELWGEVGELVVAPLAKATAGSTTWFVSPDAELNRIPFAALSSPKGDGLLGEAVNLRLLTTGRELLDLAKSSKSAAQKPLVVANPNFDRGQTGQGSAKPSLVASNGSQQRSADLGSQRWIPLPGTAKEGKAISELTDGQLLMEEKATALAVQEQAAPKVLHMASHAYFVADQKKETPKSNPLQRLQGNNTPLPKGLQGENPLLRSGIVLAGANQPNANSNDDGYLTALEVAKLDWQGTGMVVVSGCESGKGEIQAGEGVYGLKRAIAVAGARSSLLSLWKVDDAATAAFMQSFYKRLKGGEGRADALAATQQEFREHQIPGWRHPYVWAAFQLSGDWKPIRW
ncbi:Photosystem I assembly protein Ycf3 [Prochlorococcus marinus str. MIT 1312]|nr:Photosystem I assembly protein Ycf3 [Prochlorococcus marinus str. MIT 1312]